MTFILQARMGGLLADQHGPHQADGPNPDRWIPGQIHLALGARPQAYPGR